MTRMRSMSPSLSPSRRSILTLLAGVAALFSPAAHTMTVAPASLETLVQEADYVVHGHVLWTTVHANPNGSVPVRTRVRVLVWEHLKAPMSTASAQTNGDLDWSEVDVWLPGGTRGRWVTRVPGVPQLSAGMEVVLVLSWTPWGLAPIGYGMGMWHVTPTGDTSYHGEHLSHGGDSSTGGFAPRREHISTLTERLRCMR